jgi:hypothetical protein
MCAWYREAYREMLIMGKASLQARGLRADGEFLRLPNVAFSLNREISRG